MSTTTAPRRRLLPILVSVLTGVALALGPALPAAASPGSRVLNYVALGDSYAAGQALDCTHTASSYPVQLDALHRVKLLRDVACAGATTADVRTSQLGALRHGTRLVTVTVGANDLDLARLEAACTTSPSACDAVIAASRDAVSGLLPDLVRTYLAIAARAPHAEILVTGYPLLVASGPLAEAQAAFDATIRAAVEAVAATGVDIHYVDVQFTGHTIGTADPWFVLSGPNAFHPNAEGEAAIAAALAAAIG